MSNQSENESSADNQQERLLSRSEGLKFYLAGFTDGEGCFSVTICKHKSAKFRWKIDPLFQVYQHKDNSKILYYFEQVFGCGYVSKKGGNPSCYVFCVDAIKDLLQYVIPFFEKYPLLGEKYTNFILFKRIVNGLAKKEHQDKQGFTTLVKLAFKMNRNGRYRRNKLEDIIKSIG